MKKKLLWLDDRRNPFLNAERRVPIGDFEIEWVLNYEQFVDWIETFGLPDVISFDHDLADEHYTPVEYWEDYVESRAYQERQVYVEKTGAECAEWLVNYCSETCKSLPIYHVHSANPPGRDKILKILKNFEMYLF